MACRSSRLEYDERVCLASASDGVLQSVEYRLRVGRACRKAGFSHKNVSRYKAVSCSLPHGGKQLRNIDSRHYREKQQTNR